LGVYGHGRNISTSLGFLGLTTLSKRTKLTGRSAHGVRPLRHRSNAGTAFERCLKGLTPIRRGRW
jgi:hypothetical protein